jgi:N-methylhydantoinase A
MVGPRYMGGLEESARAMLLSAGVASEDISFRRSADVRYVGQGYEVVAPVPDLGDAERFAADLRASFEMTYERPYKRTLPAEVEMLNGGLGRARPG